MKTKLDYNQLSKSDIFLGISPEQIEKILPCITFKIRTYDKNKQILEKGSEVGNMGIVLEGTIALCKKNSGEVCQVLAKIEKNNLFGEGVIFSSGRVMVHEVIALENTRILYLKQDFFLRPCGADCPNKESHGEVMRNMLRILSDRTQILNKKISYLTAPDLKTKLAMYLYDLHQSVGTLNFNLPLNRDRLSGYLSVARPSLSREFINLKNIGVIDFHRSAVQILNLPALYEIAHPDL